MVLLLAAAMAHGDAAYLLEEPYGLFGSMNPTGHAAVYLSNVCADTPTHLRLCRPGETGVVISRYHRIKGLDWLAIPLVPYLYAVENLADIPTAADTQTVAALRDAYRRMHLQDYAPNGEEGERRRATGFSLWARPTTANCMASRSRPLRSRTRSWWNG